MLDNPDTPCTGLRFAKVYNGLQNSQLEDFEADDFRAVDPKPSNAHFKPVSKGPGYDGKQYSHTIAPSVAFFVKPGR